MRTHLRPTARQTRRGLTLTGLFVAATVFLSGCASNGTASSGWLPQGTNGGEITNNTGRVTNLWVGTWIAALAVGLIVWGLTVWVMVAYRRKKTDVGLPPQLRYNVPIEILYTVVPIFMVVVLFYYTARDESELLNTSKPADVTINVIGKQWSWDFNYVEDDTHETGAQAIMTGEPGAQETIPTMYLPVGERIEFVLTARDVIHSFWVPSFLQKMDMIPGRVNKFQVVPTQTGTFKGACAELCGAYHSHMLFNVKVVSRDEYEQHLSELRAAGQTGLLNNTLSRQQLMQDQGALTEGGN